MIKSTLAIHLELIVKCPYCETESELRETDHECDYFWTDKAIERLNGRYDISETIECQNCDKEFLIDGIEVL